MINWLVEFTNSDNPKDLLYWGIEFLTKVDALGFIKKELSSGNCRYRYAVLHSYDVMKDKFGKPIYFDSDIK